MSEESISEKLINNLVQYLEKFIKAILIEYKEAIPETKRQQLSSINDYKSILQLNYKQTISFSCNGRHIALPMYAVKILSIMKKIPGYGINKKHKCYKNNEILNRKTYFGYALHVFLKGMNIEEFFLDTLLHETVHFCGSGGSNPFREGLTELKAREVAQKYHFPLSRCGYNKEVNILTRVQDIIGSDLTNRISFATNEFQVYNIITGAYGIDVYNVITKIRKMMSKESEKYIATNFKGHFNAIRKAMSYMSVNYKKVYPLIEELAQIVQNSKECNEKKSTVDLYKEIRRSMIPPVSYDRGERYYEQSNSPRSNLKSVEDSSNELRE